MFQQRLVFQRLVCWLLVPHLEGQEPEFPQEQPGLAECQVGCQLAGYEPVQVVCLGQQPIESGQLLWGILVVVPFVCLQAGVPLQ